MASKKSKILAMALCASVMTGIYASPVMAAELWHNNKGTVVTDNAADETKVGQIKTLEGLEEIKVGTATDNNGLVKVSDDDGGLVRVGESSGKNVRLAEDGVYISTNGVDKKTGLTAGTLTLAGKKLTSVQLANINDVITEEGAVKSKGDVISINEWSKEYSLNKIGHNTQAIGYSGAKQLTTVNSDFAVGKYFNVDRETGEIRALKDDRFWLDGEGNLTVNNGTAKIGTGANKVELFAANNTVVTNENGTTFTNEDGASTLIDGDVLETGTAKVDRLEAGDTVVDDRGVFVKTDDQSIAAQLTEDGLKLGNESLTDTRLGVINKVIQEDGSVVSQGDVTSTYTKEDGSKGHYYLNKVGAELDILEGNVGNIGDSVKHIEHYDNFAINGREYDATVIEDTVAVSNGRGIDVLKADGTSAVAITNNGTARFGAKADANVRIENGGVYVNGSYNHHVASLSEDGLMLSDAANGQQTLTATKIADIQKITRTGAPEYGYTTNIEGSFRVKSDGSFGTDNDTFVVNDLGEISAANGEFFVDRNGAVTAQAGSNIGGVSFSGGGDLNNVNHIDGAEVQGWGNGGLEISGVAMENGAIKVNAINGATVNYYGEGGLEISGVGMLNGDVSAQTFNGVSIEKDTDGSAVIGGIDIGNLNENVAAATKNIAGIKRTDSNNDGIDDTTTIENRVSIGRDEFTISGYGNDSFTMDSTGARFAGDVFFNNGYRAEFTYANGTTSLGDLAYNLDDLTAQVNDIYNRTQGIDRDANGNTVISNDGRTWENGTSTVTDNDGATVTVGEDVTIDGGNLNVNNGDLNVGTSGEGGSGSGEGGSTGSNGGNGNFGSDINVGGNANVNGTVTVGDASDGKYTQVGESGMTIVGKDENNNTTTNNISDKGMTVTGENGTNNISDSGMTITGKDGNTTNNISDKGMTVTGSNGTTNISGGDISVDNSVTVAGGSENKTTINNEGITVGDKGTSIKHDEISVGDGGYIGGGDVVSGEGVSLNQTAERVGHLENRVGELEDRVDKVGAMSAAIANLRTMGYDPAAPTEVAVGIGQYRDETGAALGLFHYPNRDFMLSLSVSTSGDEVMGGIGATWKFGRKSPEKVAEIKKAQAEADARRAEEAKLAKAEEMKQAAKEAKIKAQQERHAKMAAEMKK